MMKKEYITPTLDIVEFDAKQSMLLGASRSEADGEELSNKRQYPTVSTWSSSNWNAEEEF